MGEKTNFDWSMIGDISEGRSNLGLEMPVAVYRLFEYTMRATLEKNYGKEKSIELLRESGELAGHEFAKNVLDTSLEFNEFVAQLQQKMTEMKIGVLRIESYDMETNKAVLTVAEDLDCSGLPVQGETVCNYDEGFIAGILGEYLHKPYTAVEVDCWAKGDRVCRFHTSEK